MDLCDCGAVLAFALDDVHGVTCSEVRQLRDEEAASAGDWQSCICHIKGG